MRTIADVDRSGVRISVTGRSAYGLWLERNIKHAELVRTDSLTFLAKFVEGRLEALALEAAVDHGCRELPVRASSMGSSWQCSRPSAHPQEHGRCCVCAVRGDGEGIGLRGLIERHGVRGLTVAPPA